MTGRQSGCGLRDASKIEWVMKPKIVEMCFRIAFGAAVETRERGTGHKTLRRAEERDTSQRWQ
jgi:hypothetical protein